jgi:uncharacterized membrane protein YhhN
MKQLSRYLFAVVFILETGFVYLGEGALEMISKPLIVPSLLLYYFYHQSQRNRLFLLAMFFCWLGDVFLMFQSSNELFFIFGLGSFLVGHLCLIATYRQLSNAGEGLNNPQRLRFSFPILLISTGLITILYPRLGDLKIPVIIYSLVLSLMVLQALYRYGLTSARSFWFVFTGAFFFLISDSLIAINKFLEPLPLSGISIMVTYMLAQYLITKGASAHTRNS